jgi:hypothetical protein
MDRRAIGVSLGVVFVLTGIACAEFATPTAEQIKKAAKTPAAVKALIADATPAQAAQVVKVIILEIATEHDGKGHASHARGQGQSQIAAVIRYALTGLSPEQAALFAFDLGTACGESLTISSNGGLTSSVQGALATYGGETSGPMLAQNFATAFMAVAAPAGRVGVQGQNQNQAPPPIEPPVSGPYPAQQ